MPRLTGGFFVLNNIENFKQGVNNKESQYHPKKDKFRHNYFKNIYIIS